ncbi:MAG TPA: hypothetical protein VFS11_03805 [Gemmatimonadales bacterium]|nr:hypothetical protein [Gemmatimonadales bacterium]
MLPLPQGLIAVGLNEKSKRATASRLTCSQVTPWRLTRLAATVGVAAALAALAESGLGVVGAAAVSVLAPDAIADESLGAGAFAGGGEGGAAGGGVAAPAETCKVSLGAVAALAESLGSWPVSVAACGRGVGADGGGAALTAPVESLGVTPAAPLVLSRAAAPALGGSDVTVVVSAACALPARVATLARPRERGLLGAAALLAVSVPVLGATPVRAEVSAPWPMPVESGWVAAAPAAAAAVVGRLAVSGEAGLLGAAATLPPAGFVRSPALGAMPVSVSVPVPRACAFRSWLPQDHAPPTASAASSAVGTSGEVLVIVSPGSVPGQRACGGRTHAAQPASQASIGQVRHGGRPKP